METLVIPQADDRYARQRLVGGWDQEKLEASSFLVVGAGAIGNEVLKLLALLGARRICVIDFDRIETSNLSRTILFSDQDVGLYKAEVAARRVMAINPETRCVPIVGDIEFDLGIGTLAGFSVILGCLDSGYGRWVLNGRAYAAEVPWVNAGIAMDGFQVALFDPREPERGCYECLITNSTNRHLNERWSCTGFKRRLPTGVVATTAVYASAAAAVQVNETVHLLCASGGLGAGVRLTCSGPSYRTVVDTVDRQPGCPNHELRYEPVLQPAHDSALIDLQDIFARLPNAVSIELSHEHVLTWHCTSCGHTTPEGRPVTAIYAEEALCPICGTEREPTRRAVIIRDDPLPRVTLDMLRIPLGEILWATTRGGERLPVQIGEADIWGGE